MSLLARFFSRLIRDGPLTVIDGRRNARTYGRPEAGLAPVTIRLADRATEGRILLNPALGFGEAFVDGRLTIEQGDVRDLLDLIGFNLRWEKENPVRAALWRPRRIAAALETWNWRGRSRRNAASHYDLPDRLFEIFLDGQRQYSCGYFADPGFTLEEAQAAKMAHVAAKLRLEPGQRLLDLGCGWGGLALYLARIADVEVLGITLSEEQLKAAREAAGAAGLADRVRFALADWRDVGGRFDRIVSVGMFEHVGPPHYRPFLARCRDLLTDEGVMLLHTIGRADGPAPTDPWLARYIFPGGYVPALSQIAPAVERSFLWLTDLEIWRDHYARTLACWYDRTRANGAEIAALRGERFLRMWLFYLAGGIAAFRHDGHVVFQLQLARSRDALPPTRDYMAEEEARLLPS
jgi:cyclopropane-fatty-acyl-phospholipid synthase